MKVGTVGSCVLVLLSVFACQTKATRGFPDPHHLWTHLPKAGEFDVGCLHNLTLDNRVQDRTFSPEDERTFLLEFYQKTGGPKHWKNRDGWNTTEHHCKWHGIQCYPNNTYVKWIDMMFNNLVGTPPNLWKFRNLQGLCISRNNNMKGQISDIVSSNMTRLRRLCLSFSALHGRIPWRIIVNLQNLEKLQICCMFAKGLKGDLPKDIGKLSKLQVLSVGENDMKGDLPISISNLTKVWFMDLEYVNLTSGNLSYFSSMTNLQFLHLTNCGLNGTIPDHFGQNHPNLIKLNLYDNNLKGELQHVCLLGLKKLQQLSLGKNKLHGLLPRSLGSLDNLKVLDLSQNNFNGFQENMTFNAQLEILYMNGNSHFNHKIKSLIGALQPCNGSLRILITAKSSFTGEIPKEIWNLAQLMYLDLSCNNVTGSIPAADGFGMPYLFHLNLASNSLTGELDPMTFFSPLPALTYLNIKSNTLLRGKHAFQTYMSSDYGLTYQEGNFSCPSVHLTSTGGVIELDPSYYDYSLCFCNKGFYGYANHCLQCMDGASCQDHGSPSQSSFGDGLKQENNTRRINMTIHKGYWPCCNGFSNITRLVKCDKEEIADEDICSPSGECQCHLINVVHGKSQTSCNSSCVCRYGNTGRFCSRCIDSYYKRGDVCIQCPAFQKNFPVVATMCFVGCLLVSLALLTCFRSHKRLSVVVMFIFVTTLTVLHFKSIIPGWFFIIIFAVWIIGLSSEGTNLQSFICIAVFFFQSLDAMLSEAKIWPRTIVLLKYKITNVFNFELAQLTCSFSGVTEPLVSHAIFLLLPAAGIVGLWLLYIAGKAVARVVGHEIERSTFKRIAIQILLLVYFPITAKTFNALSPCEHNHGLSYLKDAPWLDCKGTSYEWLIGLGCASLVIYVIGVPVLIFIPLLFKQLNHDGDPVSEETNKWLKPLYEEFRPKCRRYFPLIFLARRLLLAVFLSLVPTTSCYQILGITAILMIFIIIVLIARPYQKYSNKFEFENMADIIISVILLLSFVGLAFLRNESTLGQSLVWLVLSFNMVIVVTCVGGILVLFAVNLLRSPELRNNVQYEQIPE